MLTADLVQARVYKGEVRPRYIDAEDPEKLAVAEALIEAFRAGEGRPRHELDGELKELVGTGTDFLFHRALAKLLFDRSRFDTEADDDPESLRRAVFEAAAEAYRRPHREDDRHLFHFDRKAVLEVAAGGLEIDPAALERGLYADLKDEQVLIDWKPCQPRWLLERYNVALAQGVLLRAVELEIKVGAQPVRRQRELFRKIKFFQLLHRVESDGEGGYAIRLDGPMSLFKASGKYGVKMGSFLPTLLHFDRWSLEASLLWGPRRRKLRFRLSSEQGLKPTTRLLLGQWQPEELTWLPEQFEKLGSEWTISSDAELVTLGGQGVLVPDFVFRHPSGTRVFMEVLGFWSRGVVETRLELLRRHGPENFILALSRQLAAGREGLEEIPGEAYLFRATPIARQVLALLEERFLP